MSFPSSSSSCYSSTHSIRRTTTTLRACPLSDIFGATVAADDSFTHFTNRYVTKPAASAAYS